MLNSCQFLTESPTSPGVYFFRDKAKKTLYVGKAKNLRHRLKSYFQLSRSLGPLTVKMLGQTADIKWLVTETELEAFLLEADLIRRLKPYYNSRGKDDKSYKFITIG